jgi:predicted unusual protein kinase regulating ubiquinone biosynthesis (AarF/ABC1/UbiB family)
MLVQGNSSTPRATARPLLQSTKDARLVAKSISERLSTAAENEPDSVELLQLIQQQAELIAKYQVRLDQTNATLMQNTKTLQRVASQVQVRTCTPDDGQIPVQCRSLS